MQAVNVNNVSVLERENAEPNVAYKWILINNTVGDNVKTETLEIFRGQDPKTYEIYYLGGRTGTAPATPPHVFLDLTRNGRVESLQLIPGKTTTVNGTAIILKTAHGQSRAEGIYQYLQANPTGRPE